MVRISEVKVQVMGSWHIISTIDFDRLSNTNQLHTHLGSASIDMELFYNLAASLYLFIYFLFSQTT